MSFFSNKKIDCCASSRTISINSSNPIIFTVNFHKEIFFELIYNRICVWQNIVCTILLFFIVVNRFEFLSLRRADPRFWGSSGILSSVIRNVGLRSSSWDPSKLSDILRICLLLLKRYWRVYLLSVKVLNIFLIILNLIFCELLYLIDCSSVHDLPRDWCFTLITFFGVDKTLIIWRIDHLNVSHLHGFIVSLTILIICLLSFVWNETH